MTAAQRRIVLILITAMLAMVLWRWVPPRAGQPTVCLYPIAGGGLSGIESLMLGRPIDLNRASSDELQALPGVGPVLAERIASSRASVGRFVTVDDLRRVRGIGAKTVERLRPYVRACELSSQL